MRNLREQARLWERADRVEQAEYRDFKRQQRLQEQLATLAERGAIQVERFNAYPARAQKSYLAIERYVAATPTAISKISFLREQIELRALGFGWSEWTTTWRKGDETVEESITRLQAHLKELLLVEKERELQGEIPTEAPLPEFKAKSLKQLGQATADSIELAQSALCSPEQLAAAIEREFERREAAGFSDSVQATQPLKPPALDADLVGAQLEVCWHYVSTEDNKTKVPIWCPAKVTRVADGTTDKGRNSQPFSTAARALAPRGMLLLEWEPDPDRGETEPTVCWYLLDPQKWNADSAHRAWRFHPAELVKRASNARKNRSQES
ncbi:hypothetical protein AB1Y20_008017 [Prymnesium parvum]|uniref:Uncharacterized protein n=1 Tax=Prymnesium parvum TaxID=97485 RepID=A0AB34ISI2_PRYPA